jgi:hypothetical protein
MRAEHDRVDEAGAWRRLGNLLHARESMRDDRAAHVDPVTVLRSE